MPQETPQSEILWQLAIERVWLVGHLYPERFIAHLLDALDNSPDRLDIETDAIHRHRKWAAQETAGCEALTQLAALVEKGGE